MCVDIREMSDQNLTQILPLDPKISAKKRCVWESWKKLKSKKKENENAIFANIDFRAK